MSQYYICSCNAGDTGLHSLSLPRSNPERREPPFSCGFDCDVVLTPSAYEDSITVELV